MWKNPRPQKGCQYVPTRLEKFANAFTHLPWVPFSLHLSNSLIQNTKNPTELIVALIYGVALVCLFSASSAYHCCTLCQTKCRVHDAFHYCDRLVIFLFIAASYTPWLVLREYEMDVGWMVLKVIWTTAFCGVVYQYFLRHKWKAISFASYLTIGVLPALCVLYIKDGRGLDAVALGGALYIVGSVFFQLDGVVPLAHAIWHCFVAAAAYTHYCAITSNLLPG